MYCKKYCRPFSKYSILIVVFYSLDFVKVHQRRVIGNMDLRFLAWRQTRSQCRENSNKLITVGTMLESQGIMGR